MTAKSQAHSNLLFLTDTKIGWTAFVNYNDKKQRE